MHFNIKLGRIEKEEAHPDHLTRLELIISDYLMFGDLFSELQAILAKREILIEENKPQQKIDVTRVLGERVMAHLLMKSQKISSEASKLSQQYSTLQRAIASYESKYGGRELTTQAEVTKAQAISKKEIQR